jgi:hypothetical protein
VAAEAEIGAGLGGQRVPHGQARLHQRDLALVAVEQAAPAPVAAGLLATHHALLQQRDAVALACQRMRRRDADDARADHDDIGGIRQRRIARQRFEKACHRGLRSLGVAC